MGIIQLSLWASKTCRRCGIEKSTSDFHRSTQNKDGLQPYCRECRRIITLEWQHKNAESHRIRVRKYWRKHPGLSGKMSQRTRNKRPDYYREYDLAHQRRNRHKYAEYSRTRFHRQRGNGGSYTQEEWNGLCARFNDQCVCCGTKTRLTVDHVIPVIKGGTSNIENLQPLCGSCNSRKGQQIVDYRNT